MAKSAGADKRNTDNKIGLGIKLTFIAVAVLCLIMLVYSVMDGTGLLDRNTVAMTVGEDEITVSELNKYYHTTRNNFLSQYSDVLLMYGYDYTSASFDAQACLMDTTMSWKQYFLQEAESAAQEISLLYQEALKNGYTEMSESDKSYYDRYFTELAEAAEAYGVSEEKYLKMIFGNGTTRSDMEDYFAKRCLASGYYNTVLEGFGITDAMVNDYYLLHASEYDLVEYYAHDVSDKADADALLAKLKNDGSNFDETIQAYLGDSTTYGTGHKELVLASTSTAVQNWLKSESRTAGDMDVIQDETNNVYTVIVYLGTHMDLQETVSVRHTLLATESAASDATDAEKAEVDAKNAETKAKVESLYAEWQAAGATEEGFIEMAKEHTADSNGAEGGLYTGVYKGQMVAEFEDWCFDESRQPGDHGIVETSYGYHIMYFVEHEGLKVYSDIRSTMTSDSYNEYLDELLETYTIDYNDSALNRM